MDLSRRHRWISPISALRKLENLGLIDMAMREEFISDVELLRGKLATLAAILA